MCEERNNWFAEKPNHSFDDVTGMDELKTELKNDHEHAFLFYGDNGCGKIYLAEQILQERADTGRIRANAGCKGRIGRTDRFV